MNLYLAQCVGPVVIQECSLGHSRHRASKGAAFSFEPKKMKLPSPENRTRSEIGADTSLAVQVHMILREAGQ
jgi:hypothetical protein